MGPLKHPISAASAPRTRTPSVIAMAAVCVIFGAPSWAGDMYEPPVMDQTSAFSWAGGYVGAVGGYNINRDETYETFKSNVYQYPYHLDGFSYGAKAGYNFDVNTFIVGVEGDLERSNVTGGFYNAPDLKVMNPGGVGTDTTSWQGSVRARMGMTADRFMIFATGGYAFAQMQNTYYNPTYNLTEKFDRFRNGWTIGGGVDYAVTEHIIVGAEYRHTEFLPITNVSTYAFFDPVSNQGATGRQAPISDAIRLSVSFKF